MKKHNIIKTAKELVERGWISSEYESQFDALSSKYSIGIPEPLAELIGADGLESAIGKQFIPQREELEQKQNEDPDPIADEKHSPVKGIVHRYPDRVLFKPVHSCAVYCRFCFRRDMVGRSKDILSDQDIDQAIDYIQSHQEIWEVIFTGGDPLVLSPRRLKKICDRLDQIPHVSVIRFHTRIPVMAPHMMTQDMYDFLASVQKTVWMCLHINHADELTPEACEVISQLNKIGIPLLSQSVLLKGVNDEPQVLDQLFRRLIELRIKPYYLHQLDFARGTSHFRVSLQKGQQLIKKVFSKLSGIARPTYVLDIPGGFGKVPVLSSFVKVNQDESQVESLIEVEDWSGKTHLYKE